MRLGENYSEPHLYFAQIRKLISICTIFQILGYMERINKPMKRREHALIIFYL